MPYFDTAYQDVLELPILSIESVKISGSLWDFLMVGLGLGLLYD
jgi:hypothetical protein